MSHKRPLDASSHLTQLTRGFSLFKKYVYHNSGKSSSKKKKKKSKMLLLCGEYEVEVLLHPPLPEITTGNSYVPGK